MAISTAGLLAHLMGLDPLLRLGELAVIESEVHGIITSINQNLPDVKPENFRSGTFIPAGAFGAHAQGQSLDVHHTKAHGVMADTLVGLRADLEDFLAACHDARKYLNDADLTAAGDLNAIRNAVNSLATGTASDQDGTAHRNAQVNHRNDVPVAHRGDD